MILPSILRRPVPYSPLLYAPWLLLQIGLVLRITGDLTAEFYPRQWGGMVSAVAILVYFGAMLFLTLFGARIQRRAPQDLKSPA
jgi:hypothetical protein